MMEFIQKHAMTIGIGLLMFGLGIAVAILWTRRRGEGFVSGDGTTPSLNYDVTGCYIIKQAMESYKKKADEATNEEERNTILAAMNFYNTTFVRLGCGSYMLKNGISEDGHLPGLTVPPLNAESKDTPEEPKEEDTIGPAPPSHEPTIRSF